MNEEPSQGRTELSWPQSQASTAVASAQNSAAASQAVSQVTSLLQVSILIMAGGGPMLIIPLLISFLKSCPWFHSA